MEFPVIPDINLKHPMIEMRNAAFYGSDLLASRRTAGNGTFMCLRPGARGSEKDCDGGGWAWDVRGNGMQMRGNLGPDAPDDVVARFEALERAVG